MVLQEPSYILLVEDNPDDERLTLHALKAIIPQASIEVARDGEQALATLLDPERHLPCLVLLDLKLPKVHGIDVLRAIRSNPRTTAVVVVVLTSSDEPVDIKSAYEHHANSYVRKPVSFDDFISTVREISTYWTTKNIGPLFLN